MASYMIRDLRLLCHNFVLHSCAQTGSQCAKPAQYDKLLQTCIKPTVRLTYSDTQTTYYLNKLLQFVQYYHFSAIYCILVR